MKRLSIDAETFSSADLSKTGVYRYVEAPDFAVLLFGYAVDDGEVRVIDLAQGEQIPPEIIAALTDENVMKYAYNANFERVCLSRYLGYPTGEYLDPTQWRCSMIWSAYLGLPLSLAGVGAALALDKQKLTEGKELIRYFCQPCPPTKSNGGRERNRPADALEKWTMFKAYNARDVETERAIQERLKHFPVPQAVWEEYWLDQEINDRGIRVDMTLVQNAIRMDEQSRSELSEKMRAMTALQNPNSVAQMKTWLAENGLETDSLGKKQVAALLKDAPDGLADVLALRQQLAKSSVKKYQAMANTVCADNRIRGCFQFYGANRSGRWAGRNVQLQNLPQNHMDDLADARELVRAGAYEDLKARYASVPDVLSELIRTALVPYEGGKLIVADFSAIEARVIAYLAGEQWRLEVFQNGGDIYCASASQMFRVPVEKHGVNGHLRQKGKIAELALGYGGSVGALKAMGALDMGLMEDELKPLVDAWRAANPKIVKLWWDVDSAVMTAVRDRTITKTHGITFTCQSSMLFITLPSGRQLSYVRPRIGTNQFGSPAITYMGLNSVKKWDRIESYGPKFVENCVAEDTLVVTDGGIVPIQHITARHRIWDGVEFVSHDGLIHQGIRLVLSANGVMMTPDHRILTTKGWIECDKASGFDWQEVSLPDCAGTGGEHKGWENAMVMPVRMRKYENHPRKASDGKEKPGKVLRMYAGTPDIQSKFRPWNEPAPCLRGMAFDETAMRGRESPSLPQLWRARDNGMPRVEPKLSGFLDGYGTDIPAWSGIGSHRQQSGIQSEQLPLDNTQEQQSESSYEPVDQDLVRRNDTRSTCGTDRDRSYDAALPPGAQLADRIIVHDTGCKKPVFDIRNCGPRHRFVVWSAGTGRIVSNCVQAISRDILCYAMKTLRCCNIVAHVHDEIIIEADPQMSLEAVCEQMGRTPPWVPGLVLRADGDEMPFYKKT